MLIPKYKCHKEVQAAEIHMISVGHDNVILTFDDCEPVTLALDDYLRMIARYQPKRGDFLVVYEDGYQAFSPRMAFLNGYSKIST
jgi:hypothetical protein